MKPDTTEEDHQQRAYLLGYSPDFAEADGGGAAAAEAGGARQGDRSFEVEWKNQYHHHHHHLVQSQYAARREAQNRLARDMLVFLLASVLWVIVIFFFLPWPSPPPSSSSSSSSHHPASSSSSAKTTTTAKIPSTTAATAAAAAMTMTTPPPPPIIEGDPNDHGIMTDTSRFHNVTSGARLVSCGNSTAEALAEGCAYDTLLNAWVPARCLDREWIEEYQDDGSWAAFKDKNLTEPLAPQDMGTRDHYYTSVRDHVNHCAMLWRKQFWTLFEDRRVFDTVIVNSYHTEHCAEFLSNLLGMERTEPTLVRVGFSGCWVKEEAGA